MHTRPTSFDIDSAAILFLAQMAPDHTNVYRVKVTMKEPVCPDCLQQAADRLCPRFPSLVAGFRPGAFRYCVIPAAQPPRVGEDPGFLRTMSREEIESCAYRIYYTQSCIIMEAFHALADGYGALASVRALLGEYVYLRHGSSTPERAPFLEAHPDWKAETQDGYQLHSGRKITALPSRYSYRLPGADTTSSLHGALLQVPSQALLKAARDCRVSVTTLLSVLMAESIMELQRKHSHGNKLYPVRIMVPADLRRKFPSRTLRNFSLYALPTLEPEDAELPRAQRLADFQQQLREQTTEEMLGGQITRNVKIQQNILFRALPLGWKRSLMLLSNRLFGETNSSITLTNLGQMTMSPELLEYVQWVEVYLMPRRKSPYNCGAISCGDTTSISITRFGTNTDLEELFFGKVRSLTEHTVMDGKAGV